MEDLQPVLEQAIWCLVGKKLKHIQTATLVLHIRPNCAEGGLAWQVVARLPLQVSFRSLMVCMAL